MQGKDSKEIGNSILESFRFGIKGSSLELKLLLNDWGFELNDIIFPIEIWHGVEDKNVPVSNGKLYAELLPNSSLHLLENEGHLSILDNFFEHILKTL